jgi:outer membrane protein
MKKIIVVLGLALASISCNNTTDANGIKSAYIDTSKLMEESTEAKDIEEKYKAKAEVMGAQLKVEATKLEGEKNAFQANASRLGTTKIWRIATKRTTIAICSTRNATTIARRKRC